jgi:thiamine-phosphate diphosphorylase
MERARFMLEGEAPYLQLRFKESGFEESGLTDRPLAPHREEISRWPEAHPATRLIINDDLEFARAVGAWGVHLGQEDLRRHSITALREGSLSVGISTHTDEEIRRAIDGGAALVGFGPMFPTGSKETTHAPQGVARLREVVASCVLPVVAIGGINDTNLDGVVASGVAMVAMIAYLEQIDTREQLRSLMTRMRG